jgi:signal transduction histidine kinase
MVPASEISSSHRFPAEWKPEDPVYACLRVTDDGGGIAPEDIETIFDPFFTTHFTGRGLGLPVALGIVRAHGGAITVESTRGVGSAFRAYLPVIG